jgi:hypothetical protein
LEPPSMVPIHNTHPGGILARETTAHNRGKPDE